MLKNSFWRSKSNNLSKKNNNLFVILQNHKSLNLKGSRNPSNDNTKKDFFEKYIGKVFRDNKIKRIKREVDEEKSEIDFMKILTKNRKKELSSEINLNLKVKNFKYLKRNFFENKKKFLIFKSKRKTKAFIFYKDENKKLKLNRLNDRLRESEFDEDFDSDEDIIKSGIKKFIKIFSEQKKFLESDKTIV